MSLISVCKEVMEGLRLIPIPYAIERLCSSIGCHIANLHNLENEELWHAGMLANLRIHVVYMAPSGFAKTTLFRLFLDPEYGLLSKAQILTDLKTTFSQESWLGTITEEGTTEGVLQRYSEGIIGADDWQRLKVLMEGEGINHDEAYLMSALESGCASKELALGSIEENRIGMTFWCGIRPTKIALTSGLARRFSFQAFFPTIKSAQEFKEAGVKGLNRMITTRHKENVAEEIRTLKKN